MTDNKAIERLDLLARMADRPEIHELVAKAKMVSAVLSDLGVEVRTSDEKVWQVRKSQEDELYCTCPAWRFSKERPRTCKHLLAVSMLMDSDDIPTYVKAKKKQKATA